MKRRAHAETESESEMKKKQKQHKTAGKHAGYKVRTQLEGKESDLIIIIHKRGKWN